MYKVILFLIANFLFANPDVYHSISDIKHPSWFDYRRIEKFLKKGKRPELKLMGEAIEPGGALFDYNCRARRFRMVGDWPWKGPQFEIVPFNCSMNDKKICILTYASYNQNYPLGIEKIKEKLKAIGFKGHFVYRIGGWPDLKNGSLKLAHVPYAFKPCFLKEIDELGYELVLWLDASIRPMKNLDLVFRQIEEKGYFFYPSGHTLAPYCNREVMEAMGEAVQNAKEIESVAAGIFGLNLKTTKGRELMNRWYAAAQDEVPFFSSRPDQNSLSILVNQLGWKEWQKEGLAWEKWDDSTLFFIDWKSIQ